MEEAQGEGAEFGGGGEGERGGGEQGGEAEGVARGEAGESPAVFVGAVVFVVGVEPGEQGAGEGGDVAAEFVESFAQVGMAFVDAVLDTGFEAVDAFIKKLRERIFGHGTGSAVSVRCGGS